MIKYRSHEENFRSIIERVFVCPKLHSRWLNTLSFLENSGARKIASSQDRRLVSTEVLKHAAEEARHAYFLRSLSQRVLTSQGFSSTCNEEYNSENMLGGRSSLFYLPRLDSQVSRLLKKGGTPPGRPLKELAYLLVTYAIEKRAQDLYPAYQEMLKSSDVGISVRAMVLEEEEHLAEMERALAAHPMGGVYQQAALEIESKLCTDWVKSVEEHLDALAACVPT